MKSGNANLSDQVPDVRLNAQFYAYGERVDYEDFKLYVEIKR
jgi:hypothetical protein